jgi:hypothetical protein
MTNVPRRLGTAPDRHREPGRGDTARSGWARNEKTSPGPGLVGYLAVFALFCFGFFGVFAFLSMSLLTLGPGGPSTRRS